MGRPKGSKNTKTKKATRQPKEKLNITLLNLAMRNLADLCADMSFLYREQRQQLQFEQEMLIKREAEIIKQTEKFLNDNAPAISKQIDEQCKKLEKAETAKEPASVKPEPKPADLGAIFGTVGKDPVSK